MTARLFSKTGETRGREFELDGEAVIGRDSKGDLVIDRPLMSGRHARVFFDEAAGRYVLEDLGSLNGTELDGDRVTGPERLGHLHVITFAGNYDFFFQDLARCARRHPGKRPAPIEEATAPAATASPADLREITAIERDPVALPGVLARRADGLSEQDAPEPPREVTAIERLPVALPGSLARRADEAGAEEPREHTVREKLPVALPGVLARRADAAAGAVEGRETVDLAEIEDLIAAAGTGADSGPDEEAVALRLVVTEPDGKERSHPLAEGENLVGRGAGVQVALPYPDLSRRHAALTVAGGDVCLRDLGSRNQTFLEDAAVEPDVDVEVKPGARLRFGSVEARLEKTGGGAQ